MPDPTDVVDEVRLRVEALAEQPVEEHVAAFDAVHRLLQDALAATGDGA